MVRPASEEGLEALLADPTVEEVMINGPEKTFVISAGRKVRHELRFADDDELRGIVACKVRSAGRVLDDTSPLADVRLPDGSRLNVVIPPLAPMTTVTIRRFVLRERSLDDLMRLGMLGDKPATFLRAALNAGINMLICGGTSSGKTTLLNALCASIERGERVITIEDTRELYLDHALDDVCALEAHVIPGGQVTIRDLVRNALRMRPDRIIVGEVRGTEALDVMTAMTTGHDGSLCTIHADSPREALFKLQTYALFAGDGLPRAAVMEMVVRAIQLVIFCRRARDGETRQIDTIFEVTGLQEGVVVGQEIFTQRQGELSWTGVRPQIEARLQARGYDLARVFQEEPRFELRNRW